VSVPIYLAVNKAVKRYAHRPNVHCLHITKMLDKSLTLLNTVSYIMRNLYIYIVQ